MALTLPFGVRIAAGLLGTAFDRLITLPKELPSIGVSLAGQAVRSSFRFQQELAELATRGDELLAGVTGRAEEHPAWATFDEDEPESEQDEPGHPNEDEDNEDEDSESAQPRTSSSKPAPPVTGSPAPVHGDHLLSIAELKDQLQDMDMAAVRELLVLEQAGPGRAAYLTLLENRLVTLEHQNGQPQQP